MVDIFLLYKWLLNVLELLHGAAATLPLIIALGLTAGKRGNGAFCLAGNLYLLKWEIWLIIPAFFYFPLLFLCQLLPMPELLANWYTVWSGTAGLPYVTSLVAWASGLFAILLAAWLLCRKSPKPVKDRYPLASIKWPISLCIFSAFCCFSTFFLINWPFSGWPAQLSTERVVMAIGRNAIQHYFAAFCPAGAIALLIAGQAFRRDPPRDGTQARQAAIAMRWLSVWAAIGYLPHIINGWGLTLGLGMRGMSATSLIAGFYGRIAELTLLSIAIICWLCILLNRHQPSSGDSQLTIEDASSFIQRDNILAGLGFLLLLLKTGAFAVAILLA